MYHLGNQLYTVTGWEVIKESYDTLQAITEGSNFMVGNGCLGYRGTFAEDGRQDYAACILTDTWDKADGKWEELCTVPNGLWAVVEVDGEVFSLAAALETFRRQLDLTQGVSSRAVRCRLANGVVLQLTEEKFASYAHKHAAALKLQLEVDREADVVVKTGIDQDVWSINGQHLHNHEPFRHGRGVGVTAVTASSGIQLAVVETTSFNREGHCEPFADQEQFGQRCRFQLQPGEKLELEKFMVAFSSNDAPNPKEAALHTVGALTGFAAEKAANQREWDKLWQAYDIQIQGSMIDQVALRFNLYHAIIATPVHRSLPIGARGLSCQAYQGAAFWDQEIYNMPMYLYTTPAIARNILEYRYRTLDGARRKAVRLGFCGAFYAWISGKTGDELCPDFFFKDVLSGRDIRNHFNDWQIHISPDIAYAVQKYYRVTEDEEFMEQYGAEMVFEIARFLASRVVYLPMRRRYEILRVQGPDEYHENVDNNAFTNYQTLFALRTALELLDTLDPAVLETVGGKIAMAADEIELWRDIAQRLYIPPLSDDGLLEQFDGYFQLESIVPALKVKERLLREDEYYGYPNGVALRTQCIKQADVIQLFVLYPQLFADDVMERNYDYYEPRTLHFSSLSPSSYAIIAAQLGRVDEAYSNFSRSLMIDLLNTNEAVSGGTFIGGIHTAANGAAWQMVVHGFAGMVYEQGRLHLNPHLPPSWDEVTFCLTLGGRRLKLSISRGEVRALPLSPFPEPLALLAGGQEVRLETGEVVIPLEDL